mgnify:CR=1 FL=1
MTGFLPAVKGGECNRSGVPKVIPAFILSLTEGQAGIQLQIIHGFPFCSTVEAMAARGHGNDAKAVLPTPERLWESDSAIFFVSWTRVHPGSINQSVIL